MFAKLFRPVQRAAAAARQPDLPAAARPVARAPATAAPYSMIAVIAGRHCLAYEGTGCTVCVERCPVPGALVLEQGLPRVVPAVCTGCNVCHDVCPAPGQAVRLVPRPPGLLASTQMAGPTSPAPFPVLPSQPPSPTA